MNLDEWHRNAAGLLSRIKERLSALAELLERVDAHWTREDGIYRFYHQSFKVCHLQTATLEVVRALEGLWPDRPLNAWFRQIVAEGTVGAQPPPERDDDAPVLLAGGALLGSFDRSWNADWLAKTRPIVEAFCHARFMLEMAVKYGRELDDVDSSLPSGWAALLYLYDAR